MSKAVFLDRDGTLIRHVPYLHHVEDVQLLPGVGPALRLLKTAGYYLIVITNQAGVAYGYFTEEDLQRVNSHLHRMLQEEGSRIDAWYYCPHHPAGALSKYRLACDCRKPGGGLLTLAAQAHRLDLAASFTIGDRWSDVQAGKTGGGTGILVLTGEGRKDFRTAPGKGLVFTHLLSAARWIVSKGGSCFAHCL